MNVRGARASSRLLHHDSCIGPFNSRTAPRSADAPLVQCRRIGARQRERGRPGWNRRRRSGSSLGDGCDVTSSSVLGPCPREGNASASSCVKAGPGRFDRLSVLGDRSSSSLSRGRAVTGRRGRDANTPMTRGSTVRVGRVNAVRGKGTSGVNQPGVICSATIPAQADHERDVEHDAQRQHPDAEKQRASRKWRAARRRRAYSWFQMLENWKIVNSKADERQRRANDGHQRSVGTHPRPLKGHSRASLRELDGDLAGVGRPVRDGLGRFARHSHRDLIAIGMQTLYSSQPSC